MVKHVHIHVGGKTRDDAADKAKIAQLITDAKNLKQKIQSVRASVNDYARKDLATVVQSMDSVISDLEEAKGVA